MLATARGVVAAANIPRTQFDLGQTQQDMARVYSTGTDNGIGMGNSVKGENGSC